MRVLVVGLPKADPAVPSVSGCRVPYPDQVPPLPSQAGAKGTLPCGIDKSR